jgi:hypothetical protein
MGTGTGTGVVVDGQSTWGHPLRWDAAEVRGNGSSKVQRPRAEMHAEAESEAERQEMQRG